MKKRTIYALLVGINEYKNTTNLSGPVNDVTLVKKYLEQRTEAVDIITLLNEEATYDNIYNTFLRHLSQAKEGDTAFFYFAGHGTRETNIPKEFALSFPEEENEALICYDSKSPGVYCLADKELAVLIKKVAQNKPHIAIAIDACHSGSATRDEITEANIRHASLNYDRPLESYADRYYSQQKKDNGTITIPAAPHIAMSACSPNQWAAESKKDKKGIFTKALMTTLENTTTPISYGQLFEKIRIQILQTGFKQCPEIDAYGDLSVWSTFLEGESLPNRNPRYTLGYDPLRDYWKIYAGALHGIPYKEQNTFRVDIYKDATKIGEGEINKITLDYALLVPINIQLDPNETYTIQIKHTLAVPLYKVYTNLSKTEQKKVFDNATIAFLNESDIKKADYIVLKNSERDFEIIHQSTQKLLEQVASVDQLQVIFQKITWWENIYQLSNDNSLFRPDNFKIDLEVLKDGQLRPISELNSHNVYIDIEMDEYGYYDKVPFRILFENNSHTQVHVAVVFITPLYGVYPYTNIRIPKGTKANVLENLDGMAFLKGQENDNEATFRFKFIISQERIESSLLRQEAFSKNMPIGSRLDSYRFSGMTENKSLSTFSKYDWLTRYLDITLTRVQTKVNPNSTVKLEKLGLTIDKHPTLKANVETLLSNRKIQGTTFRSGESNNSDLTIHPELELIEFGGQYRNGMTKKDIFQLTSVENDVSTKTPLVFHAEEFENEVVLAFSISKEGVYYPIGYKVGDDTVHIIELPTEEEQRTGFRSPGRAIKFAFFKVLSYILPSWDDKKFFLLRGVKRVREVLYKEHYESDFGTIQRKVQSSSKILLVIHGIIGNTKDIGTLAQQLGYETVLAFDYENLNTPIEKLGAKLNERLKELGVSSNRKIDILAHSMGGLVVRYWIEQLGGHQMVNKFVMCGTPNGGSAFGEIDTIRKRLSALLSIYTTFKLPGSTYVDIVQKILSITKHLTTTLQQMQKDSDFLVHLNAPEPSHQVDYHVIAGNIFDFIEMAQPEDVDKLKHIIKIGNWANKNQPNDIAVAVEDILKVGQNTNVSIHEIACHHMNYFTEPQSIETIKRIFGGRYRF